MERWRSWPGRRPSLDQDQQFVADGVAVISRSYESLKLLNSTEPLGAKDDRLIVKVDILDPWVVSICR